MKAVFPALLVMLVFAGFSLMAFAQQPQLATYHETAQVLVDDVFQNRTSAFITLSSVSNLEIQVPPTLDKKIHDLQNVTSVDITNAKNCALGTASTSSCVIITISDPSLAESDNITKIQQKGKAMGDHIIGYVNKAFDINAQFWQVYIRPSPKYELSATPSISNISSANITINAVYTFSSTKTSYLWDDFSSLLLPKQITSSGGFYDVAKKMANSNDTDVAFAIIPQNDTSLYQLQVIRYLPLTDTLPNINPLDMFGVSKLTRSSYFNIGFFPLNSLVEVSILSRDNLSISHHGGDILDTSVRNGQKIPTELTKSGWIFDPDSGKKIFAVYLFGKNTTVSNSDLMLTIANSTTNHIPIINTPTNSKTDYSTYALVGIVIAAGGAIYLFTRRR